MVSGTQRFAVIMAGGSGERFWPASRRKRPKQLLCLTDSGLSMLEQAVRRIEPLIPPSHVLIVTSELLAQPIADALPQLPPGNILAEPEKRNTAACLALAAAEIARRCDGAAQASTASMAVLTADHQIGEPERFRATVQAALEFAESQGALVTIGVKPTRSETGYGYIETADVPGAAGEAELVRRAVRFREKPNAKTAAEYVSSGRHFWNSGMFFWRVSTLARGFEQWMPDLARALPTMEKALAAGASVLQGLDASDSAGSAGRRGLREAFLPLRDVSIDVGLMERAENVYVIAADFPWDDVGAWDALSRTQPRDPAGNVAVGSPILIDAHNCVVYADPDVSAEMAVAVIGVDDIVVATTPDGVLICAKDRAQDVKKVIAELRARGRERFT